MSITAAETTLGQLDRRLADLRAASEQTGANLLELELDPTRRLLDEATLEGLSAFSWAWASARLMQLWQLQGVLDTHLDRATKLRGTRGRLRSDQLAGLAELLDGDSIAVEVGEVPLDRRDLLAAPRRTARLGVDDLLAYMSNVFDEVKDVVASFARAWNLEPRRHAVEAHLTELAELARQLGEPEPKELAPGRHRLLELAAARERDPLSVAPVELERIESSIRTASAELRELVEFRTDFDGHLLPARELMAALLRAQEECELAHRTLLVKIVGPSVREPITFGTEVSAQLEHVTELADAGAWREAHRALDEWTRRSSALLAKAERSTIENQAPIQERNQLRGLLDAYRAKAVRAGREEDPELSRLLGLAQTTLFTAPTDLGRARELVRLCQQRLLGAPSGKWTR